MSRGPTDSGTPTPADGDLRRGIIYGFLAYGIWGLFPLYFDELKPAGAWEILAHRIIWTFLVCAVILVARRDLGWLRALVHNARLSAGIVVAALLIAGNWVIYVYAVLAGHTYDAALGYFLNPIVTVFLGVLVLRERLRTLQWVAVGIGIVAAGYLTIGGGSFPWIALGLAFTFGSYGLVKNKVGSLKAMHSLAAETAVLTPIALLIVAILAAQDATTFLGHGGGHLSLLVLAGPVTALPLVLFAASARRIPLVTVGLIQFVTPVLQLLCSVLLLDEHVTPGLWVGFGIVWVALVLLTIDSLMHRSHRVAPAVEPETVACELAEVDDPDR